MFFEELPVGLIVTAVLAVLCLLSLILSIVSISRYKSLYRKYDTFMRGRDAESLEGLILEEKERLEKLEKEDEDNKEVMRSMNRYIRASFQKAGVVHYDAFEGMGGKISFALALLDYTNSGIVINCMHGTGGCFLYIKEVDAGTTTVQLGAEERGALERALGYVKD